MTLNEDRKQTKYGHKRWEHMTHTRQRTDMWILLKWSDVFYLDIYYHILYDAVIT